GNGGLRIRTRRQIGGVELGRCQFQPNLNRRRADVLVDVLAAQMGNRERSAAKVQRKRGEACKHPQPPRRFLLDIEAGHLATLQGLELAAGGACAASETPSSATSLIFE